MNKLLLAYLAGVMDSDGWFTIKRQTYQVRILKNSKNPSYSERIGLKQVQPEAVKLIHQTYGGYFRIEKPSSKNGKPLHAVQLTHNKAHKFIKDIFPFLRLKKEQASILLSLRESIKRGKTLGEKRTFFNRWHKPVTVRRYAVIPEEINFRESLIKRIKKLNDSRNGPAHQPLSWR